MKFNCSRRTGFLNPSASSHHNIFVYAYTHDISNKAYDLGYNGILFNSSRNPGENKKAIVLFGDRYDPNDIDTILDIPITVGGK